MRKVTVCVVAELPTAVAAKASEVGEATRAPGESAVPLSASVAAEPELPVGTVSVPEYGPAALGANVTCKVQLPFAASVAPQELLSVNPLDTVGVPSATLVEVKLVAVTVCVVVAPAVIEANATGLGCKVIALATPVPLSATLTGVPVNWPDTVRVPWLSPSAAGLKVIAITQDWPGAILVPHPFALIE